MKLFHHMLLPFTLIAISTMSGCGPGSEVTVNPVVEMTPEQIEEMDAESDRARLEAIQDN
jgi:hypothetical protein